MPQNHKRFTFEEVAEQFGVRLLQVYGVYHHNRPSFSDKHTTMMRIPGESHIKRVFTDLGVERLRHLCRNFIAKNTAVTSGEAAGATNATEVIVGHAPQQKYPDIEKISHPKATSSDDEVLDIAVKIIAERQAFNKLKEEIIKLQDENAALNAMINDIKNIANGWRG